MPLPIEVDRSAPVVSNHEIDINASRDDVWRLHCDVNSWPTWQSDITEASLDQTLAPGASFDWSSYGMSITSTVYEMSPGTRHHLGRRRRRHHRNP